MRFLLLSAAALLAATSSAATVDESFPTAAEPPTDTSMPVIDPRGDAPVPDCPPISRYHAQKEGGPLISQKLGELPDADMYLAVYRRSDGCIDPVIARYGVARSR